MFLQLSTTNSSTAAAATRSPPPDAAALRSIAFSRFLSSSPLSLTTSSTRSRTTLLSLHASLLVLVGRKLRPVISASRLGLDTAFCSSLITAKILLPLT
jgi:hypothetical protein